ncbi:poly(R)-hydroxyalkanoic acid synthase subunit PhaE [Halapricum hydrolyticum]|uniref:Poly(3-hydroxyalkanoate) polymerase subunit PhaE n=1 Tax=Halapricum hydrolyticum TaxID=2979991 RepID=A0AAE3IDS5_9EURY|nr:poly(R)-hydroxyalkanoic acid synthase subunit PhaE [Halapricum hydrolyticum]MCU4717732.1 poly(R)-hydroxyalkanoic acid synthase subunit [Halapricum hydrolyticum]MCU4726739.1 poly(R)-hydroxyalkanoic acid synthase subunit [Halapricum hydrolyticum]
MSNDSDTADSMDEWNQMVDEMNEALAESFDQSMQAQTAFMESWNDVFSDSTPDDETLAEGIEGYSEAYEVWMDAAEQMFERSMDASQGEEVDVTEFRDIWLQSANKAFKEVMETSAFAAANGQLIESMLELRQESDDVTQESLAELGFATRDDVVEVGERLVELERRQQDIEDKLDRVLDALEE